MRRQVIAAALVGTLALVGCNSAQVEEKVISGSVDTVRDQVQELAVDEESKVEVTGYILGEDPAHSLAGSDEDHSTLSLYQDSTEDDGYIMAVFHETDDELNDLINHNTSTTPTRRVTISGTCTGKDYGSLYTIIRDCEIQFD